MIMRIQRLLIDYLSLSVGEIPNAIIIVAGQRYVCPNRDGEENR